MRAAGGAGVRRAGRVLDLGCIGPAGFRGWSGGARRSFVITPDAATPGYLAGELEPGTWQVMIGIHQLPAEGAEYRLTAEVSSTGTAGTADRRPPAAAAGRPGNGRRAGAARGARPALAGRRPAHPHGALGRRTDRPRAARFAAGHGSRLHRGHRPQHGQPSPRAAGRRGRARHHPAARPGGHHPGGHAGALGEIGWIDFRLPADAWLEQTQRRGGLLSVNHPIAGDVSWTLAMRGRPPLVEVWHWSWLDLRWTTAAGLVAGLGSGRDPGRRQRLAPARGPMPRRDADHLGRVCRGRARTRCSTACATGGWRSPAAGTARSCCDRRRDHRGGRGGGHPGGPGRATGAGAAAAGELPRRRWPPAARRRRRHPRPDRLSWITSLPRGRFAGVGRRPSAPGHR